MANTNAKITFYIPKEDYRKLRSKLILKGISASEWIRKQIKKFISPS